MSKRALLYLSFALNFQFALPFALIGHGWSDFTRDYIGKISGHSTSNSYNPLMCFSQCMRHYKSCKVVSYIEFYSMCYLHNTLRDTEYHPGAMVAMKDGFETVFPTKNKLMESCSEEPCKNNGWCVSTPSQFTCVCRAEEDFYGDKCETSARDIPEWGTWTSWSNCPVICGVGYQERERVCGELSTTDNDFYCDGHNRDYRKCNVDVCPTWSMWSEVYSEPQSANVISRERYCRYGGTQNIDSGCQGDSEQQLTSKLKTVPVRISGSSSLGEGFIEIFSAITGRWGVINGDWWDMSTANVSCRQLGFAGAFSAFGNYTSNDELTSVVGGVHCNGDERSLLSCHLSEWGKVFILSSDDIASVTCVVDLDECSDSGLNNCTEQCINSKGSYECRCDTHAFQSKCYYYSKTSKTWDDAKNYCRNRGSLSDLVEIEDLDEFNFIQEVFVHVWIGLNDQANEGDYRWADGSAYNPSAISWSSGNPNNGGSPFGNEDCGEMSSYGLNDKECETRIEFVCERPSVQQIKIKT
ncbi:uncharacterized protein [Ptychodera flava]|uniref:uncharacterized protein n=1 Tax=Ptychodera flava TaxID=63121 RepID=UPI00396A79DC